MPANEKVAGLLVSEDCYISVWDDRSKWVKMPDGSNIPAYLSCRRLISKVEPRKTVESLLTDLVRSKYKEADLIVGLSTAGITWSHGVANSLNLPMCYVRGSSKSYGEDRLVEGAPKMSKNAIIIDDTFFTGEAIIKAKASLKNELGIEAMGAITVVSLNRSNKIDETDFEVSSLTTFVDLCAAAQSAGLFSAAQHKEMLAYYLSPNGFVFKTND